MNWAAKTKEETKAVPPFEMPALMWQILARRGYTEKQSIDEVFKTPLKNLTNPFKLKDMDKAVDRLIQALHNNEKICIYADFDLDGTPGLALMQAGLTGLGFSEDNLVLYQPSRLTEGYGLHIEALKKLKDQGVSLVVTVDLGITANEAGDFAKENGLDLIVTDHHLPGEKLPEALAIVNPNRGDCPSKLGYLAGVGVAFYTIMALRARLKESSKLAEDFNLKSLLDCFCIGTITDMVPLIGDNRTLVKHGLMQLARTQRVGLRSLLSKLGMLGKELTGQDVALRFAPKLNALSRLETGLLPIDIFLTQDAEAAKKLVEEVMATNDKRRELQSSALSQAREMLLANEEPSEYLWLWSEDFHKGVIGIVATNLMQDWNRPVFVGSFNKEKNRIVASGRAPKDSKIKLTEALQHSTEFLEKHGGHALAAGFELNPENESEFLSSLSDYFKQMKEPGSSPVQLIYEAEADLHEINEDFMKWYQGLHPFGVDFEAPLIRLSAVDVAGIKNLKGGHLRIKCRQNSSHHSLEALWFSPPGDHPCGPNNLESGEKIDLLIEPQWNEFAGRRSIQLLVKDLRFSQV